MKPSQPLEENRSTPQTLALEAPYIGVEQAETSKQSPLQNLPPPKPRGLRGSFLAPHPRPLSHRTPPNRERGATTLPCCAVSPLPGGLEDLRRRAFVLGRFET